VRITVTRGPGPLRLAPPSEATPTVLITVEPIGSRTRREQQSGVGAILLPFGREGFLAEHKTLDYLPGVLGQTLAARHQAFEALYVTATGRVTEGTTSNLFVVAGGRLATPPIRGILPGVTRAHVIELAEAAGLTVAHRTITIRSLQEVEEVFLTSSTIEVMPVVRIDERQVGDGDVGPITRRVQRLYAAFVSERLRRS
jgi:branched-subunit amino acid aminotransferase/4-amino-4-deoxychorismate lyase